MGITIRQIMIGKSIVILLGFLMISVQILAQEIKEYEVKKTAGTLEIDGLLDKLQWHCEVALPFAELAIYNLRGQKIVTLSKQSYSQGDYTVLWDGKDEFGNLIASGIYLVVLDSRYGSDHRNIIIVR